MLPGPVRLQDTVPVASLRAALKLCAELPAATVALLGETVSEGVDVEDDEPQAPRRKRVATTAMDNRTVMVRASRKEQLPQGGRDRENTTEPIETLPGGARARPI